MMATCPPNTRPVPQAIELWSLARRFANSYGLWKYQGANEGCVDVSGRRYACTSTEESSRLRASGRSVSKVSALGPLSSRTEKQMARLLVGMYKLSKPFSPDSEPSWGQWAECSHLLWLGATRLPSACCFLRSMYTHNAFHLRLHVLR